MYKLTANNGVEIRRGTYESLLSIIDDAQRIGARLFVLVSTRWVEIDW